MITGFNSTVSNNRSQSQNFCAISQKHYQKAQEAARNKITYHFAVRDIQDAYGVGDISKTDAQDTLAAIKGIYPEKFHHLVDTASKWVDDFSSK